MQTSLNLLGKFWYSFSSLSFPFKIYIGRVGEKFRGIAHNLCKSTHIRYNKKMNGICSEKESYMNEVLRQQLALDYCCMASAIEDDKNHFHVFESRDGRRRFRDHGYCFLKVAVVNGKLMFTGEEAIIAWCKDTFAKETGEWFFDAKNLRRLDDRLREDGYQIEQVHPFFIATEQSEVDTARDTIQWYDQKEIEQFRGDGRFREAYSFCEEAPDVVGAAALKDGEIIGMAGASADSPTMWQIGINVEPKARGRGVAQRLVSLLKNEILERGILPYYGTALSHLASQHVALKSGFVLTWAELTTVKVNEM